MPASFPNPLSRRRWLLGSGALTLGLARAHAAAPQAPELISVRRIWDAAPHNAFTDLLRHDDRWYCVFREGSKHVSADGKLRVITSRDGDQWESAALISSPLGDARDAKIAVTPDGRLMLNGALALHDQSRHRHQSIVSFSENGRDWTPPEPVGEPDFWLWRVTWHEGHAYTIGYHTHQDRARRFHRLYRSPDGRRFAVWNERLSDQASPGENTVRFDRDGTAWCLARRDNPPQTSLLGRARPPYRDWTWQAGLPRLGGPNFLEGGGGRWLAAGRLYNPQVRTALLWLDLRQGELTECLSLPSGGDTGYPGLVRQADQLWVSYYSSHEGKTAIYLARVKLPA